MKKAYYKAFAKALVAQMEQKNKRSKVSTANDTLTIEGIDDKKIAGLRKLWKHETSRTVTSITMFTIIQDAFFMNGSFELGLVYFNDIIIDVCREEQERYFISWGTSSMCIKIDLHTADTVIKKLEAEGFVNQTQIKCIRKRLANIS